MWWISRTILFLTGLLKKRALKSLGNLPEEILAEKQNVDSALALLDEAMSRAEKTGVELTAMATCMHNVYNGIENILKQTLRRNEILIPSSPTWHKDLLNRAISENIISSELGASFFEYLGFRHFFIHAYGFMLDGEQVIGLAQQIRTVWDRFLFVIDGYYRP
jgi:uncharacterized protein YutE (UPF0331/DUF86 family)